MAKEPLRYNTPIVFTDTGFPTLWFQRAWQQLETGGGGGSIPDGDKGDIIVSGGGATWTLDTTTVVAGTYGDATNVPQFTVDSKGRVTGVVEVPIAPATVSDGDKGDVIVSGGGAVWTLDAPAARATLGLATGIATITITGPGHGQRDWFESVSAPGVTVGDRIFLQLAPEDNAEENGPEMLDPVTLTAACTVDGTIDVLACFDTLTRGPIKLIYGVI